MKHKVECGATASESLPVALLREQAADSKLLKTDMFHVFLSSGHLDKKRIDNGLTTGVSINF